MNRKQILAEVLAHLEAERFQPVEPTPPAPAVDPITPEQAAHNLRVLTDAIGSDPIAAAYWDAA